jgi:hypothetical protein
MTILMSNTVLPDLTVVQKLAGYPAGYPTILSIRYPAGYRISKKAGLSGRISGRPDIRCIPINLCIVYPPFISHLKNTVSPFSPTVTNSEFAKSLGTLSCKSHTESSLRFCLTFLLLPNRTVC